MKKIKIFSLFAVLLAIFSLTSITGKATDGIEFVKEAGLTGENNDYVIEGSDVLTYVRIPETALSGNVFVSLKYANESINNFDVYFYDTSYKRVAYKVATDNSDNSTYKLEKNEGDYACSIVTIDVTNGVAAQGITSTTYIRFKLRGGSVDQSLRLFDAVITSGGKHGFDFNVPAGETPEPEPTPEEPTGPLAISDIYGPEMFTINKEENGDQVISYETATNYQQIAFDITNYTTNYTVMRIKFTTDSPIEVGYDMPQGINWDLGHKNYDIGTHTEDVAISATGLECTVKLYLDAENEFPVESAKTLTIHSIKLIDPTVYDETEPTVINKFTTSSSSPVVITENEAGKQVLTYSQTVSWYTVKADVQNLNPENTLLKFNYTSTHEITLCFGTIVDSEKNLSHVTYPAGENKTIKVDLSSLPIAPNMVLHFYIDASAEVAEGTTKVVTINNVEFVNPNVFDPTEPSNVFDDFTASGLTLVKENDEISFTYGTEGTSTSVGYPYLKSTISNYDSQYTVFKIVYSSEHPVMLGSSFNEEYKHVSYPAGENMEAIIYLTDDSYAAGISANMSYKLYIDAGQTIDYENTVTIHSMSFELPPQEMIIKGPEASSLKVEEVADGHLVTYEAGAWRNVTYSFMNYDVKYDVLTLSIDLIKDQNVGIRVYYLNEDGSTSHIDVRNHGSSEGLATSTGTHNLFYQLEAYGLKGKELTKIELWFDPANGHSILTGEQTALIRSFELKESSTLSLVELEFTAEDAEYIYDGEAVEYAAECLVEGVVFKYHHASIVDGVQSQWYEGLPSAGGTYKVRVTYMGSSTYNWKQVEVNVIIKKAEQVNDAANISIDQETGVISIVEGVQASTTENFEDGTFISNGSVVPYNTTVYFRVAGNSNYNHSNVLSVFFERTLEQEKVYVTNEISDYIKGYEEEQRVIDLVKPLLDGIAAAEDKETINELVESFDIETLDSLIETIQAERELAQVKSDMKKAMLEEIEGYEEEERVIQIIEPFFEEIDNAATMDELEEIANNFDGESLLVLIETIQAERELNNYKNSYIAALNALIKGYESQINIQTYVDQINAATTEDAIDKIYDNACDYIDEQINTVALNTYKANKVAELAAYLDKANYRDAQKAQIDAAIASGTQAINAATNTAGVDVALANAKAALDAIKTDAELDAEELTVAKNVAYDDLDAVDSTDYESEEQAELLEIVNTAKAAINAATTIAAVEEILDEALAEIDELWTIQDYLDDAAKKLADAKTAAKAALDTHLDKADYREAQHAEIDAAIAAGKTAIDNAGSIDVVTSAKNDAIAALDAIKTDEKLDAEEAEAAQQALASAKKAAIATVEAEIGSYNIDKTTYVANINAATTTEAVAQALEAAKTDIAAKKAEIDEANKPAPQPTPEPTPTPEPEKPKKGCKGSLVASIFGMVALLGACLTFKRKKD